MQVSKRLHVLRPIAKEMNSCGWNLDAFAFIPLTNAFYSVLLLPVCLSINKRGVDIVPVGPGPCTGTSLEKLLLQGCLQNMLNQIRALIGILSTCITC